MDPKLRGGVAERSESDAGIGMTCDRTSSDRTLRRSVDTCFEIWIIQFKTTHVEMTFDPPWSPERMTEDARWELGMI